MKIRRINIKNYKSMYDSGDIYIDKDIYAFIGQNNTGKSTVLDAIQCVFPEAVKKVEGKDFHNRTEDVIIELEFSEVTYDYIGRKMFGVQIKKDLQELDKLKEKGKTENELEEKKKKQQEKIDKKINEVITKYEIQDESMIVRAIIPYQGKKHNETRTSGNNISDADLKKILPMLKVITAIRNPQNESTAGSNSYMKDLIQMLDDSIQTSIEVGSEKVNYNELNRIISEESNKRCNTLSEEITKKYSQFIGNDDFKIRISSEVNISKGTSYSTKIIDKVTNLESDMLNCGTGYQSMIILAILETYVDLANKKNDYILIIEEPEVYLHPSLQRKMIKTLINLSKDNQVIFSTHSSITVSSLKKSQISLVTKKDGRASVGEIHVDKVIDELGIRPDDIMLKQGVILVEGPDDKAIIEEILNKIDEECLNKIDVVESGSCENLRFYANAQRILNTVYTPKLLIIRDADSKSPEKQAEVLSEEINKLAHNESVNIRDCIYIIGKHSLESLYMQPRIISKICDLEQEKCEKVIILYNKIYDEKKTSGMKETEFAKIYQPKYFLEKNIDKFGYGDINKEARSNWDKNYYKKWKMAIEDVGEDDTFESFVQVRERVNDYTMKQKKQKINYLFKIVQKMELNNMESNLFAGLVERLKQFVEEVKQ